MRPIHDRMPVILDPSDYDVWLDPTLEKGEALTGLLRPYPGDDMEAYTVGTAVNNPRNDGPTLIEHQSPPEERRLFE